VQLGTGVQGVCRQGSFRVANLSKVLKDCCCKCAQSRRIQHLDVFEGCRKECVQGFSYKSSGRIGLRICGKIAWGSCDLNFVRGIASCVQVDEFHGGTLSYFVDFIKRNGWLKFSEGNSRNLVSH
jgi:hypothetical protein